jgi:uncharacterized protein with GYD domain
MATYVILSTISPHMFKEPAEFPKVAHTVARKIKEECPNVKWLQSYALMGCYDVIDIIEAPTIAEVEKASLLIRTYGGASTQTLPATPWHDFLEAMAK